MFSYYCSCKFIYPVKRFLLLLSANSVLSVLSLGNKLTPRSTFSFPSIYFNFIHHLNFCNPCFILCLLFDFSHNCATLVLLITILLSFTIVILFISIVTYILKPWNFLTEPFICTLKLSIPFFTPFILIKCIILLYYDLLELK